MGARHDCDVDASIGAQPGHDGEHLDRRRANAPAIRRVFLITLGLNFAVGAAKAIYGYTSGSIALGTDAVHAFLDGSSNVLALISLRWAAAPADPRHPYGRHKIEIVAAMGIGVLIVIGLFELATAALRSLIVGRPPPDVGLGGFLVVGATSLVNLFVARYEHRRGHELGSFLLCADAEHTRSDLYASAAVLAAFAGARFGLPWADPASALIVTLLVGRAAWLVFRTNLPPLLDAAVLNPDHVAALASGVAGVDNVHRIRSRGIPHAVHLDLHMQVKPDMSVSEAHKLAAQMEADLKTKFPEVSDVVIHIEPTPKVDLQSDPVRLAGPSGQSQGEPPSK